MKTEDLMVCRDCHDVLAFAAYGVEMEHDDPERLKMAEDAIGGGVARHNGDDDEEFNNSSCDLCWHGRGGTRHAWTVEVPGDD